jgi:hypothetical protein
MPEMARLATSIAGLMVLVFAVVVGACAMLPLIRRY